MSWPILAVRVAANVEELKRNLQDGVVNQVEIVRSSLQRMVNAYDPQVLINKAAATAAAIQQVGGASMLSGEQQARANKVLDEGIAAFGRLGQAAPAGLLAIRTALDPTIQQQNMLGEKIHITADEIDQATGKTGSWKGVWREFDNVLQAAGITIGSQAKGLIQVAEASGKTASQLGLVATAGLAAGAAFAGWNIGRWIADITGMDEKIAHLTATVMGYGDVAAQTASAKQDVINRAIAEGAPLTVSYAEAIKFVTKAHQDVADAYEVSGRKLSDAQKAVRAMSESRREEIQRALDAGASEQAIQRHYGITADTLKVIIRQKELAADASEKLRKKHDEEAAAIARQNEQLAKETEHMLAELNALNVLADLKAKQIDLDEGRRKTALALRDAIYESARQTTEATKWEQQYFAEQEKINAENDRLAASFAKSGEAAKASAQGATSTFAGLGQQITITADAVKEWLRLQVYSAKVNAILSENGSFTTQSQRDRIAALSIPDFAAPSNGGARSGGGTSNVTVNVTVNGGGSPAETGQSVRDAILDVFRSGAIPLPSAV